MVPLVNRVSSEDCLHHPVGFPVGKKKMSYFDYQEIMSTPRWIMSVLENGEYEETGVVQLMNSKDISGVGLMLKISDSEYSTFHCSPGNEEAHNMLIKLEKNTIFQITKCSKEATKILIEDIAVYLIIDQT